MKRTVGLAIGLAIGVLIIPPAARAGDRAAARLYVRQAEALARPAAAQGAVPSAELRAPSEAPGDAAMAARLLETALEFDPDFSDAWYLLSAVRRREPGTRAQGLRDLERALQLGTWERVSPETALTDLAEEQLRTGRPAEAVQALYRLGPERSPDPRLPALLGEALLARSAWAEADAALAGALRRFPRDPRLLRLHARTLEAGGRGGEARRLLDQALALQPEEAGLLLERARLEPAAARRLELLRRYREAGGEDPAGAVLALRANPKDAPAWVELFIRQGGGRRLDELAEVGRLAAGRPGLQRILEAAIDEGERVVDRNGDGLNEERYLYEGGALQAWELDGDQDGRPEARALFRGGAVAELTLGEEPAGRVHLTYEPYPQLVAVEMASDGSTADGGAGRRAAYRLPPFRLTADLIQRLPSAGTLPFRVRLAQPDFRPDPAALRRLAWRVDERDGAGVLRRTASTADGRPVEEQEDLSGDGRLDRRVLYRGGLPAEGWRDLDEDGRFEVREEYAKGVLVRLLWDEDGDGRAEYAQTAGPNAAGFWDYDGDGVFERQGSLRPDTDRLDAIYRQRQLPAPDQKVR